MYANDAVLWKWEQFVEKKPSQLNFKDLQNTILEKLKQQIIVDLNLGEVQIA